MNLVTGRELEFYHDQCSARECRLSEEIDTEYEQEEGKTFLELAKTQKEKKKSMTLSWAK